MVSVTDLFVGVTPGPWHGIANKPPDLDINGSSAYNISSEAPEQSEVEEYVFDRADVRALFILLYTVVFCCCFFGNLLVIVVVTLSRRLRSITNFFLANLAVADLCVGMFCVYQNLSLYLVPTWVLGNLMCKLYHFVHSLSYTASIFILVVICTERYFAIIHPITCKQILTPVRLRIVIAVVWVLSAVYSSPRFFWMQTVSMRIEKNNDTETICIGHRQKYDSVVFDLVNFGLLYVIPLAVMLLLYTRIAVALWDSGRGLHRAKRVGESRGCSTMCRTVTPSARVTFDNNQRETSNGNAPPADPQVSITTQNGTTCSGLSGAKTCDRKSRQRGRGRSNKNSIAINGVGAGGSSGRSYHVSASQHILKARRGVVRMLIVVVLTFAICNLPYHARKMWQYWSSQYEGHSTFSTLFTPATFLLTYFNSGINPLLYAFLSRNFRKGMRELLLCSCKKKSRSLQPQSSITRKTSVRSATKVCSVVLEPNT